jgi:ATP-dependent RNA circularization protein (DNA/RNA ligase family)
MREYHKIQSIYKRDEVTRKFKVGEYSLPEFEYLYNNLWHVEEKIDGTNIRVMYDGNTLTFGGKTDKAQMPVSLVNVLKETFSLELMQFVFPSEEPMNVCLYGEGYGKGIQKGGAYLPDRVDFILFDVWINGWWLTRDAVKGISIKLDINKVPFLGTMTLKQAEELVQKGFKSTIGTCGAEGVVCRPFVDLYCRNGRRVITKIKTTDF